MDEALDVGSRLPGGRMPMLVKIARMYHEQGLRQPEIAARLRMSQSRVSRYLKEAASLGVVRTVVVPPPGFHPELEEGVRDAYGVSDVVVATMSGTDEAGLLPALGAAGAVYLENTIKEGDRIGVSSWSSTLIATVESMNSLHGTRAAQVVQLLGGVGDPPAQLQATRLTEQLAMRTGATPLFLSAPGIVGSATARDAILADPYIRRTTDAWPELTLALVGIGSLQPSPLLRDSGNVIPADVVEELRTHHAVGDICLRFMSEEGALIESEVNDRILGISVDVLRAIPRRIAIAGGARKYEPIRAALLGRWIDVLITDATTAGRLIAEA